MSKKTNWDNIPLSVWSVVYYKEDTEEMSEEKVKQLNLGY